MATIKNYQSNLNKDVVSFLTELQAKFPDAVITSGYRENAVTKFGKKSHHSTGNAVDLRLNPNISDWLYNTKEGVLTLNKYGLGMIDEGKAENKKWGNAIHVGKDSVPVERAKDRYKELFGQEYSPQAIVVESVETPEVTNTITNLENTEENTTFVEETPRKVQEQEEEVYEGLQIQEQEQPQQMYQPQQQPEPTLEEIYNQVSEFIDTPIAQQGGTWANQQAKVKAEKDAKLKELLAKPKPIYKKKTIEERIIEKANEELFSNVKKSDNTRVVQNNNVEISSKVARNKTDKEIGEERQARIDAQAQANAKPFDWGNFRQSLSERSQATGDAFRVSNEPNFFDDYLNPASMIGSMADNLGQAPLRAEQTDSYMPYVTAVGTPLVVGALAGIGTNGSTGQFVNNLANPLAGTGDLVNNLGNKYLPNAYKLNPKAFKPDSNKFYRQVDNTTYNEGLESGFIKGKQDVNMTKGEGIININKAFGDDAYYNKGSLYYKDNKDLPYLFEANLPEESFIPKVNGRTRKYTTENTSVRVSNEPLPINDPNITTYKKDWLQGYKQVEVPKTDNFNSEINWGSWNKEIPNNKSLTQEYNAIEQQAKANGTWMKNSDGSAFNGTPEQFVQQNSENFKKSFPDYYGNKLHHRSKNEFNTFDESKFGSTDYGYHGKGIYASEDVFRTTRYGDKPYELYVNTKNKGVNPKYNEFYRKDLNESLNTLEKNYLQEKNLPKEFPEYYPNIEKYNNTLDTNFEKDISELIKNKKQLDNYDLIKVGNEVVIPFDNPVKSAIGNNGMFDMTNPNIYKSVLPIGLGASYMSTQETPKYQQGGNYTEAELNFLSDIAIKDNQGQYNHPGKVTEINSPNITMKGLDYSVLGISKETGEQIKMQPNKDYFFKNTKNVIEIPTKKNKNG